MLQILFAIGQVISNAAVDALPQIGRFTGV